MEVARFEPPNSPFTWRLIIHYIPTYIATTHRRRIHTRHNLLQILQCNCISTQIEKFIHRQVIFYLCRNAVWFIVESAGGRVLYASVEPLNQHKKFFNCKTCLNLNYHSSDRLILLSQPDVIFQLDGPHTSKIFTGRFYFFFHVTSRNLGIVRCQLFLK